MCLCTFKLASWPGKFIQLSYSIRLIAFHSLFTRTFTLIFTRIQIISLKITETNIKKRKINKFSGKKC